MATPLGSAFLPEGPIPAATVGAEGAFCTVALLAGPSVAGAGREWAALGGAAAVRRPQAAAVRPRSFSVLLLTTASPSKFPVLLPRSSRNRLGQGGNAGLRAEDRGLQSKKKKKTQILGSYQSASSAIAASLGAISGGGPGRYSGFRGERGFLADELTRDRLLGGGNPAAAVGTAPRSLQARATRHGPAGGDGWTDSWTDGWMNGASKQVRPAFPSTIPGSPMTLPFALLKHLFRVPRPALQQKSGLSLNNPSWLHSDSDVGSN